MSYLIIDEDLKTFAHNAITGNLFGYHTLDTKDNEFVGMLNAIVRATPAAFLKFAISFGGKSLGAKDKLDQAYFDHHWNIDKIKPKIAKWCKETKDACLVTDKIKSRYGNFSSKKIGDKQHEFGNSRTFHANPSLFDLLDKKKTIKDRIAKFTTALTCIPIKSKDGFYYIYPIFDADDIRDIKVLCKAGDFYTKSLKQWKNIDHQQFKK